MTPSPPTLMRLADLSHAGSYQVFPAEDAELAVTEARRLKLLGHAIVLDELNEGGKVTSARVTHYKTCLKCIGLSKEK